MDRKESTRMDRRSFLKVAAGTGLAAAGGLRVLPAGEAASEATLSVWTGFPELVPFYNAVGTAYAGSHPNVKLSVFSTSLREAEQKLSAAVPTGTGPDIYDIGTNISVKFIDGGLIDPNPADVAQYLKGGPWNSSVVDFFSANGKSYGLPLMEGSP